MKTVRHPKSVFLLLFALGLAGGYVLRAEDKPAEPEKNVAAPAAPPAPSSPAVPATPPPVAAANEEPVEKPMRELTADEARQSPAETSAKPEEESADDGDNGRSHGRRHLRHNSERFSIGGDSTLGEGESAEAVISILGSSTSAGEVNDAVVSIMGGSKVTGGSVGDAVVSVLGNTYVNGEVHGEVVTVLGNVELGPKAVVHGDVVCVGGKFERAEGAVLKGEIRHIAVAGGRFDFGPLATWLHECLLYGRPLAFHRDVLWAWCVALAFLAFYAVVALIAPAGVNKCVETFEQRPGSSLLTALLALLLTPVAYILMAVTIAIAIGVVLIPVFSLGLMLLSLFGKLVMLAWLGRRFTKLLGDGPLAHPVFGVLIGGLIVMGLYTIPIVGFITYKLLGILGLGVVIYTLISQAKANRPPKPVVVTPMGQATAFAGAGAGATTAPSFAEPGTAGAVPPPMGGPIPPAFAAPAVISAATLPRAGFWIRVAAALLDFVLVFVALAILLHGILNYHGGPGINFLLWVAYHPIMWKLKGTTIGGIICGLKVVRLDDRPIDWGVAIVRSITSFMSLIMAGLGFIWVAFDDERQSWHDKVAGTTIVKVPKGMSLL
ncbi:MAG TPA: RDD family protein [Lacunisphaera sp.]|nr:RDD family protein [Lacunisphaera sp.]